MVTTTLKLQHSSSQISQSHTEKLNVSFSPTDEASLKRSIRDQESGWLIFTPFINLEIKGKRPGWGLRYYL